MRRWTGGKREKGRTQGTKVKEVNMQEPTFAVNSLGLEIELGLTTPEASWAHGSALLQLGVQVSFLKPSTYSSNST